MGPALSVLTLALVVMLGASPSRAGEEPAKAGAGLVAFPENATTVTVLQGNEPYMDIQLIGWAPKWAWMGFGGSVQEKDDGTILASAAKAEAGADVKATVHARKTGPRQLRLDVELQASKDTGLTYIVAALDAVETRFGKGKAIATGADGATKEVAFPLGKKGLGDSIKQLTLVDNEGSKTTLTLDPPCNVPSDGAARIVLAFPND